MAVTMDEVFEAYAKLTLHPDCFVPQNDVPMFMSIDTLQQFRPDLTDEKLAEAGFIRGTHLAAVTKERIIPVTPEECP